MTSLPDLDLTTLPAIVRKDHVCSDIEYKSVRSDRESRGFTRDPEPDRDSRGSTSNLEHDGEGKLSNEVDLKLRTGIAIRKYSFPEENANFN